MEENFSVIAKDFFRNFAKIENENGVELSLSTVTFIALAVIIFITVLIFIIVQTVKFVKQKRKLDELETTIITSILQSKTTDKDKNLLCEMVLPCIKLGHKIDLHTNRQDNFIKVSSLVYQVSILMGKSQKESILNCLVSMIYDAGFLQIDKSFFRSEILTDKEKQILRTHVLRGADYLDFVPSPYMLIFIGGVFLHHENFDGSGYPEGLMGEEIPQLAQIIHIAESYISLTSRRSYHKIRSSQEALSELKSRNDLYDSKIVNVFEKFFNTKVSAN